MLERIHFLSLALLAALQASKDALGFLPPLNPPSRLPVKNSRQGNRREDVSLNADLITFDLDDTIFPVGPVVADANKALFSHLKSLGCDTTQEEYLKTSKTIRIDLAKDDKAITYTELRKRTIRAELQKQLPAGSVSDVIVEKSYDLWEEHRHIAAETHLYPDTVSMLKELKAKYPDAILGAITNAKGNPLMMKSTREYFDFCVSGEDEDVFPLRKPDEGIYRAALDRFRMLAEKRNDEPIDTNNPCWIHIGDDLANDVGASAKCGAKAIWLDLEDDHDPSNSDPSKPQFAYSSATKEEVEKRKALNEKAQQYISRTAKTLESLPSDVEAIVKSFV